jgi:hypothetical protein
LGVKRFAPDDPADVLSCVKQYHTVTADPILSSGYDRPTITYAVPCPALAPAGEQGWQVSVVDPDDITIRIYFTAGSTEERCSLLRRVVVAEGASKVSIRLLNGRDPALGRRPCSLVGRTYVTQVTLDNPLLGRSVWNGVEVERPLPAFVCEAPTRHEC